MEALILVSHRRHGGIEPEHRRPGRDLELIGARPRSNDHGVVVDDFSERLHGSVTRYAAVDDDAAKAGFRPEQPIRSANTSSGKSEAAVLAHGLPRRRWQLRFVLRLRSAPEVPVAEVLPSPRTPERQVGSVARGAPCFPAAAMKTGRTAAPISR